ncbi:PDGLE domain-containing protein [Mycolicibacterium litorale]|uniref:Membrane protein n=1 Tax=Mycolicibacterium litorale TaxID=758802 RepID=A0AAD1IJ12_9MYCO|nr:PDGLE domain-containing protein [Mycolicibacterium litorale]MCV7415412.1 PDGLE domain-containing protein [Mycolicibacterium litorale]TDY08667.1 cobalt/nickel transport protein [Mycolicibacterium litorale]BBY16592.1 membrane protein [Mycolicibacterium litorale]
MSGRRLFWVVFAAITVVIAGGVSYVASASPDGLDATTLRGCEVIETADGESLTGDCIARHADDHALAGSPLADYAVGGRPGTNGPAGVLGVVVTAALGSALFWLIARGRRSRR